MWQIHPRVRTGPSWQEPHTNMDLPGRGDAWRGRVAPPPSLRRMAAAGTVDSRSRLGTEDSGWTLCATDPHHRDSNRRTTASIPVGSPAAARLKTTILGLTRAQGTLQPRSQQTHSRQYEAAQAQTEPPIPHTCTRDAPASFTADAQSPV
jgi:hypothetical protein